MVLLFFCVSGVLGAMRQHPSITTRDNEPVTTRSLEADARLLAQTIEPYPGALVVVANDWPLFYDLKFLRQHCHELGQRIVGAVRMVGDSKESSVLEYMVRRPYPFVVVASEDFEFGEATAANRIDVNPAVGFDLQVAGRLHILLNECGEDATRPVSDEDVLQVAGQFARPLHAATAYARVTSSRRA
ncbi:hypothetical protein [Burkholderia pseudomallei]|uniref:hypothetical protein n=1 Tax=Burkholderia pseudomallei TaxID=28450 RepID=UPI003F65A31E